MPPSIMESQILKKSWTEYTNNGIISQREVRPIILESWKRCKKYGVVPLQTEVPEVLSIQDIESKRKENEELISITRPIMERLYEFVTGSGFIVSLADKEGFLIEVIGDEDIVKSARRGNFKVGANWSEYSAGTNAVGTCLVLGKPLQIFAYEHYCICSHKWTCSGAPIYDPKKQSILGVLCMTGRYESVHSHTLGMVFAAVHAVENEISLRNAWMDCEYVNNQKSKIIDSITEGIIAVNQNNQVNQINKICCQLLGISENRALHQDIFNVVGPKNRALVNITTQQGEVTDQSINIYNLFSGQSFQCTVTSRSIICDNDDYLGKVILLSEFRRTRKLVQKMLGNQAHFTFDSLIGKSSGFIKSVELAKAAVESTSSVLLLGESGTGKEIFAQAIHNSSRCEGPFLAINCSGIPRDLIGSELFGYAEGAFTGARKGGNPGKFELADGGTLFLDEIGDMPLEFQALLLRVLEEKQVMRIGSGESIPVDVRIIAATNKDIWNEVKKGTFRDDLFFRINVLIIDMIPLRKRKEDIVELAKYFIEKYSSLHHKEISTVEPDFMEQLVAYDWPGNVRQLENVIERTINQTKDNTLTIELLPEEIQKRPRDNNSNILNTLQQNEKTIIMELMEMYDNNISRVARDLNIARTTLYRKLRIYNIKQ